MRKTISYSVSSIQKVMIENVVGLIFDQALPQFMTCISSLSDKKGSTIMNWDIQNELMLLKIRVYKCRFHLQWSRLKFLQYNYV